MLVPDSSDRAPCEEISRRLHKMLKRCSLDRDYTTKRNPWSSPVPPLSRPMVLKMAPDAQQAVVETQSPQYAWDTRVIRVRGARAILARELRFRKGSTRTIIIQGQNWDIVVLLIALFLDTLYNWLQGLW